MSDLDVEETWALYRDTTEPEPRSIFRNQLVLHYTSLVRYVAAKVATNLPPQVDRDDLASYGLFGLMDAISKFDHTKGVKFETYAITRIRGAIIDEIRSLDWVPRSVRSKARDIEKARADVELATGRPASHLEVAQVLGLSLEAYWTLASQANAPSSSVDSIDGHYHVSAETGQYESSNSSDYTMPDPMANPEDLAQSAEVTDLVSEAIAGMDESAKTILTLYYLQELTLAEIGVLLGVTESWVCQLQSKALAGLRESLGRGGLRAA